jgi:predicted phosphodiesterase
MSVAKVSEAEFIELFELNGAHETARLLGLGVRAVYERRARIEHGIGRQLKSPDRHRSTRLADESHPARQTLDLKNGTVLVGSDAHYWPGPASTAHRAFVHMAKKLKPDVIVLNGDVMDGSTVSRHPSIGWEKKPKLVDEIIACQTRLREIVKAAPKAKLFWTLGNHDSRFETRIATVAPEFAKVHGVHLKDHFGDNWKHCWSLWINDNTVIKHRFKSGLHAPHNNTMWAGKHIVTGHLHSLKVMPVTDYNATRFGVDCGTLAAPHGPQFIDYTEDSPVNWRSGFAVLTYESGKLLWPSVAHVLDEKSGVVEFEREVFKV